MAGNPIEAHVIKQIDERGGWDAIRERIASGETDFEISLTLLRPDGRPISRSFFNRLLHDYIARDAINEARIEAAAARVDHAIDTAKTAFPDRDHVQKARLVIDTDLRVAGYLDRERFGERPAQVNVLVNNSAQHLDALRQRMVEVSKPLASYIAMNALPGEQPKLIGEGSAAQSEQSNSPAGGEHSHDSVA